MNANLFLKKTSNGHIAGIIGAVIAHIMADLIASLLDPTMRSAAFGIMLGGLLPLLFIPLLEKYIVKSDDHIMVGDHEDIEKDLNNISAVIDFSSPDGFIACANYCIENTIPLISGTTGLSDEHLEIVSTAKKSIPILLASNMYYCCRCYS